MTTEDQATLNLIGFGVGVAIGFSLMFLATLCSRFYTFRKSESDVAPKTAWPRAASTAKWWNAVGGWAMLPDTHARRMINNKHSAST